MASPPPVVAHRRELADAGIDKDRIRRAVRAGRWQEPVPGVVVAHSGSLSRHERHLVALAWAGPLGRLSHTSALLLHRARAEEPAAARRVAGVRGDYQAPPDAGLVQVSVPHGRHLESSAFVVVHQTRRVLGDLLVAGLPVTSAARAAVDVAISSARRADVDHVVSDVLQRGLAGVDDLAAETRLLARRATPWLRSALGDATRGMRSVGEAELRRVVRAARLPEPEWNARVTTPQGDFFLDAYWREHRVGAEADGMAYHLTASEWQKDLVRQNAVMGIGVRLLRFPVVRLRRDGGPCGAQIGAALGL